MAFRIALLVLLGCSLAQAEDWIQDLAGKWKFHPGDDPRWAAADFDDSQWAEIEVPKAWRDAGYPDLLGYGWYRTSVRISAGENAFYFAAVDDAYEVYVNGIRIGVAGQLGSAKGQDQYEKTWPIPASAYVPGEPARIAVRVWMTPPKGGIIEEVRIGSKGAIDSAAAKFRLVLRNRIVVALLPTMLQGIVTLLTGLFVLLLFAMDRSHREYLWFGCYQLCLPIALAIFFPLITEGGQLPLLATTVIAAAVNGFIIQFVWTFLGMKPGWWARSLQCALVLDVFGAMRGYNFTDLLTTAVSFTCIWLLIRRFSSFRHEELLFSIALLLGFLSGATGGLLRSLSSWGWLATAVSDAYGRAMNFEIQGMQVHIPNIASVLAPCLMMLVLLRRFERTHREEIRMRGELESARAMQSLMASAGPAPGFVTEAEYRPASEVGGDFYQILPGEDGSMLVVVGDVSGKGMKAAMLASAVVGALGDLGSRQPGDVLSHLNRALAAKTQGGFVTCCCSLFAPDGEVTIANAGHLSPYLGGREVEVSAGLPLGVSEDAVYEETTLRLEKGGALTFLSDGVIEAANQRGELFGFERTREISSRTAVEIARAAHAWGQNDDITVVSVRREVGV